MEKNCGYIKKIIRINLNVFDVESEPMINDKIYDYVRINRCNDYRLQDIISLFGHAHQRDITFNDFKIEIEVMEWRMSVRVHKRLGIISRNNILIKCHNTLTKFVVIKNISYKSQPVMNEDLEW